MQNDLQQQMKQDEAQDADRDVTGRLSTCQQEVPGEVSFICIEVRSVGTIGGEGVSGF